jgi:hypothetical protein
MSRKFKTPDYELALNQGITLREALPANHLARFVVIGQLDLSHIYVRYAREVLKVDKVRTTHNTFNLPMIAIDRKLGYVPLPGTFRMEKVLE